MERKFLKGLGVADEAIDKIMAENGKDVEKAKGDYTDVKQRLDDAQKTLKGFEGVDVEKLKSSVEQLTKDLDNKEKDYAAKLDERDFHATLKTVAASLKARNHEVALAALGKDRIETLKASKNREKDIEAAFKALKEDKETAYLFETERPPRVVSSTPGAQTTMDDAKSKANEGLRGLYGKGVES